jgi:hypothetical protein
MKVHSPLRLAASLTALAFMGSVASAQEPDHTAHHGTGGSPAQQQSMGGCPMMGQAMMGGGTMGRMGRGRQGMMGMGHSMMQGGMMQSGTTAPGMASMFGSRVTPMMNLSVEDVRGYLTAQLDRLKNKRLKIGEIKTGDGTITADIVTVDNSLVQKLKVDRQTGAIDYQE